MDIMVFRARGSVKIFSEKESGTRTDRPLARAIEVLDKGDVLLVTHSLPAPCPVLAGPAPRRLLEI
jgi:hypothetical protein